MSSNPLPLVFVTLLLAACTTAQTPAPTLTQAEAPRGCALGVAGATVVAEDTSDGIALSFTSKDRPEEMRERANDAAAQHGPGERLGRGHEGRHGSGGDHGLQMIQAPAARSVADDIENGARVRFVPVDPAEKEVLRAKLRDRADAMNAQPCK
ncbi:MAG: hypothetical protein JWP87_6314 [Labilithrix sp.]|nr:hypothetical protein [Labilithrix sp.]